MGKSKLVDVIQYEATALVEDFKKHAGKPGPIPKSITVYVLNIIWQMVASKIKFWNIYGQKLFASWEHVLLTKWANRWHLNCVGDKNYMDLKVIYIKRFLIYH